MAGEWIRMRHALQTDPKVAAIGKWLEAHAPFRRAITRDASCDVTVTSLSRHAVRYIVTGALHAVWCAADEHADGGVITGADLGWIDEVTDLPGFGHAMESVSWAEVIPDGLRFPKFASHNTSGAERTRRYREKLKAQTAVVRDVTRDVTCDAHVTAREENRKEEEYKDNAAKPPSVSSKSGKGKPRPEFVPPTVAEVASFATQANIPLDAEAFVDHYTSNGWKVGKAPMRDWQAAARNWAKRNFGPQTATTPETSTPPPAIAPPTSSLVRMPL